MIVINKIFGKPLSSICIRILMDDLTLQDTHCIVNAGDESMSGGTGVDGAIHELAGPELSLICRKIGGCRIGCVQVTPGFNLRAKWIIHTVAPIKDENSDHHADLLQKDILKHCFLNSLKQAEKLGAQSISFPSLGGGAYGWSPDAVIKCAQQAMLEKKRFRSLQEIRFIAFNKITFMRWQKILKIKGEIKRNSSSLLYHKGIAA